MMSNDEIDGIVYTSGGGESGGFWEYAKKSLSTFLGLPLAIVLLFILGAATIAWLDQSPIGFIQQLRQFISRYIFKTSDASGAVLGLIATGLLTMTSLVISMLLIALQQTAGNMGNLVYDQFMKRRRNQICAGYIVGTEELIIRVLPTADQRNLTRELDHALAHLAASLDVVNSEETAQLVRDARQSHADKLPRSVSPPAPSPILFGRPGLSTNDADQAPSS